MAKNERVKELGNELRLNQAAFGKEIGVSQRQGAHIELDGNITERNFESICRVFNVNPQWLESGEYPMFVPSPDKDVLDRLAEEKGLNDMEKTLIGSIIDLPRPAREAVIDWVFRLIISVEAQASNEEKKIALPNLKNR